MSLRSRKSWWFDPASPDSITPFSKTSRFIVTSGRKRRMVIETSCEDVVLPGCVTRLASPRSKGVLCRIYNLAAPRVRVASVGWFCALKGGRLALEMNAGRSRHGTAFLDQTWSIMTPERAVSSLFWACIVHLFGLGVLRP